MIGRKSFLILITTYLTNFIAIIGFIVLAKLWGNFAPEAIGIIGFAMSFLSLFGIITDLGFSAAHVKRISEGKDLGICIGTFATAKIVLTSLMVVAVFVSIYIWKNVLHGDFYDATTESVIIVLVFYSVFTNLQSIATQTFTGRQEIAKLQTTTLMENVVKTPLCIIVAVAGVSVMGRAISPAVAWPEFLQPLQRFLAEHATGSLAMTYVFGIMATFFVGMWLMRGYPIKRPTLASFKNYFSFAYPLAISSVISTIATNIDTVLIGYFWASAEVGYYFSFQRILGLITVSYVAVGTVLFPSISKKDAENDPKGVIRTVHLAERYISMIMIPPLVVSFVFVKPAINILLDASFLPGASVFILLVIYAFIRGMIAPYSAMLHGINRVGVAAKLGIITCLFNICFDYLLIPETGLFSSFGISGASGAALAAVMAWSILFFGVRILAKKFTGIKLLQSHTPRHIIAGSLMGVVLYYIAYGTSLFPVIRWYALLGFAGLGLVIYLGVLFLLKEFKKQDLMFFLDILRPKEMYAYLKSELKTKKK